MTRDELEKKLIEWQEDFDFHEAGLDKFNLIGMFIEMLELLDEKDAALRDMLCSYDLTQQRQDTEPRMVFAQMVYGFFLGSIKPARTALAKRLSFLREGELSDVLHS